MRSRISIPIATLFIVSACHGDPTSARGGPPSEARSSVSPHVTPREASSTSSVRWNRIAMELFRARGGGAGRTNTYLSLAQYRAVLAAQDARHGQSRPSLAGAAAGASVVVLEQFYPLDVAAIEAALIAQRAESPARTETNKDFAAGEAIGRQVGAAVLALAASDNVGATSPGVPPVGPGYWVSSGAPLARGNFGARPFFLTSGSELRLPPPPAFGSPAYLAALAEVRALALARTPGQVATVVKWVPFSGVVFNGIASDLIDQYQAGGLDARAW